MIKNMYHWYILIILSILLFFHGFFPVTKTIKKYDYEPPTHIYNISLKNTQIYSTDIEKTIVLIIDALRLDFINPSYMPLTSNITSERGCFNKVKVETPTVTLPRIKALIAGYVPQFTDLILNLASTDILEDSLIHSAYREQKRMVFYGDNTWLKLFPHFFVRHEGTHSFYVRDFKEVDYNVTRNVNFELEREDWDIMILHYLGLDHIGHVYGPFSSLIPEKLKEMDELIYKIYSKMLSRNHTTLLAITGDHGMRDSGGHGGSTHPETHVPLLISGLHCSNGSFPQTDSPANLAVLLGLKIPSTGIGQLRTNLLPFSLEKLLFVLRYNTLLLVHRASLCDDDFELATKYHIMYLRNFNEANALKAIEHYKNCSSIISEFLMRTSVKQNIVSLIVAILVMFNSLIVLIATIQKTNLEKQQSYLLNTVEYFAFLVMALSQFVLTVGIISWIFIVTLVVIWITNVILLIKNNFQDSCSILMFLIISSFIHPFTFFSSSFVEEEHQFWYFFNSLFLLITVIHFIRNRNAKHILQCLAIMAAIRFLRTINSTGDKWASYPDLSDWLLKQENYYYYQAFCIVGLGTVLYNQYLLANKKRSVCVFNCTVLALIFIFKNNEHNSIMQGKFLWLLLVCHLIIFRDYLQTWILISTLTLKLYNIILISYCIFTCLFYSTHFKDTTIITLCYASVGSMLYFAQGHSNSLASVDISVGYIGLSEYQPVFVIPQVLCHTYSMPILCHFLIFRNKHVNREKVWMILFSNRLLITVMVCIITLIFRHHLFIWSVFAPKLFIEFVHIIMIFVECSIYCCFKIFFR